MSDNSSYISWITKDWLHSILHTNISIIDVQPDVHDYLFEHLPNAVYLNENHFRTFQQNIPTQYTNPDCIQKILRQVGLQNSKPVVIYGSNGKFSKSGDGLEQTMAAYSLARFGHQKIFILDGGLESWNESHFQISKDYPSITESDYNASVNNSLFLTYKQFKEVYSAPNTILIDVRPRPIYQGQALWSKPGHIPGAVNFPWRLLMEHQNPRKLRSDKSIDELIQARNISPEKSIILYCGTGREATAAFIYFKFHRNYPNVKIYEGSFTEWCIYPENPTVTGPDPN